MHEALFEATDLHPRNRLLLHRAQPGHQPSSGFVGLHIEAEQVSMDLQARIVTRSDLLERGGYATFDTAAERLLGFGAEQDAYMRCPLDLLGNEPETFRIQVRGGDCKLRRFLEVGPYDAEQRVHCVSNCLTGARVVRGEDRELHIVGHAVTSIASKNSRTLVSRGW